MVKQVAQNIEENFDHLNMISIQKFLKRYNKAKESQETEDPIKTSAVLLKNSMFDSLMEVQARITCLE